jgi:hypothetical protein
MLIEGNQIAYQIKKDYMMMDRRIGNIKKSRTPIKQRFSLQNGLEGYLKQNTQIIGSHSKIFTARESIIHGKPLILNVCNLFKQDETAKCKTKKITI